MPIIIPTPPEAIRRQRIRTAIQVFVVLVAPATGLLGASWWAWVIAAVLGLVAFWITLLDSWEPWWPPSQWWHASKGHHR